MNPHTKGPRLTEAHVELIKIIAAQAVEDFLTEAEPGNAFLAIDLSGNEVTNASR